MKSKLASENSQQIVGEKPKIRSIMYESERFVSIIDLIEYFQGKNNANVAIDLAELWNSLIESNFAEHEKSR